MAERLEPRPREGLDVVAFLGVLELLARGLRLLALIVALSPALILALIVAPQKRRDHPQQLRRRLGGSANGRLAQERLELVAQLARRPLAERLEPRPREGLDVVAGLGFREPLDGGRALGLLLLFPTFIPCSLLRPGHRSLFRRRLPPPGAAGPPPRRRGLWGLCCEKGWVRSLDLVSEAGAVAAVLVIRRQQLPASAADQRMGAMR